MKTELHSLLKGKRILVTGASGFIASNVARFLRDKGHVVLLLGRKGSDRWRLRDIPEVPVIEFSPGDHRLLHEALGTINPHYVMNFAQPPAEWYNGKSSLNKTTDTAEFLRELCASCLLSPDFKRFIHAVVRRSMKPGDPVIYLKSLHRLDLGLRAV